MLKTSKALPSARQSSQGSPQGGGCHAPDGRGKQAQEQRTSL